MTTICVIIAITARHWWVGWWVSTISTVLTITIIWVYGTVH